MKVRVIGSTKPGYTLPVQDALMFAGHEAGICYMPDDFDAILAEPEKKTMGRVRGTIFSGHHSVAGHPVYNLLFEGIPKIIAMLLNNEQDYNTSEKSGRYTKMGVSEEDAELLEEFGEDPQAIGEEKEIYEKWIVKFTDMIQKEYPQIDPKTVDKLAKENARYFISVFTPATTMGYTVDLRQANYLIGFAEQLYQTPTVDPFLIRLKPYVLELANMLRSVCNVDGLRDNKGRGFSLFATRERCEEFGENYCVNYAGSFAQLAQAHRHRSLTYEMTIPDLSNCTFFVPPIIQDEATRNEYLQDMEKLKGNYPQGMLVKINERGPIEKLVLKCHERLCGAAQLEICRQTNETLKRYINALIAASGNTDLYCYLSPYVNGTKCKFGYYHCDRPCPLGPKNVHTRKI